jgi:hypothetical protein
MAQLTETFDISTLPVGNTGSYDPLPAGWYSATIAAAEIKPTKDGTGQYIKCKYQITGPSHSGRVVFGNINIRNASQKAEEIGRQQLGDIMRALNISRLTDTDQMIGGMLSIKLDIRPADGQYQAQNEVRGFRASSGMAGNGMAGDVPTFAPTKPTPAPSKGAAPPWVKK